MSQRMTEKDARTAFVNLLDALGKREATSYGDVGGWVFDYAACYGGVSIREITSTGGGQTIVTERMTLREFVGACYFLRRVTNA